MCRAFVSVIDHEDTIAAISTPPGTGGVAVVRLSGRQAIAIAATIFKGNRSLHEIEGQRVVYGKIVEGEEFDLVDEVLVTVFRAPNSYTCEDVVEIACHGGAYLSHKILKMLVDRGARIAAPGEFTQRAFLNGRLDLSQAEAVADLINAKTELAQRAASAQLDGGLTRHVRQLRERLINLYSLLELELDFAEEDVEIADRNDLESQITAIIEDVELFLKTYHRGKILREGVGLVIAGKPNVGKSSLLNALLKEERAIVTDVPGTTRDTIEEQLDIGGALFRVVDTAGIRESADTVEALGVERSFKAIREADLILFVVDGSQGIDATDKNLMQQVKELRNVEDATRLVGAVNKVDLERKLLASDRDSLLGQYPVVEISAETHAGFEELERILLESTIGSETPLNGTAMLSNARQEKAVRATMINLQDALESLQKNRSSEFVAADIREATQNLGEIIGEVATEDILDNIFAKFCIGK